MKNISADVYAYDDDDDDISAPGCPFCGSDDTIDNGDSWYCYTCNARFEYD